jgi:hypothetical protein
MIKSPQALCSAHGRVIRLVHSSRKPQSLSSTCSVGSLGVAAATACALYATQAAVHPFVPTFDHNRAARLLLTVPGYPLQALNGLVLGFLLPKRLGGWISQFAWLVPLSLAVLAWLNEPERLIFFEHLRFDGTCPPGGPCFTKAIATLLVVSSTFYSVGAIVGIRRRATSRSRNYLV